ncbi:Hypothetical predicted protein [Podarcis lilfordi]|uniref:Uncharacterized protein n=1 Tax=Podarcis lilfordi TaxID=74358 RepID=A0AA35NZQ8_9SAUR|nr:Hypothetical predicted protein [Podarcis lilfordi]
MNLAQVKAFIIHLVSSHTQRSSSTVARYVINFEREESEVKGPADDISTISSNKIENEKGSISTDGEIPATKPRVTDLQQMVAMALQEDKSLSMDLGTLQFADETIRPSSDVDNDIQSMVTDGVAGPGLEVSDEESEDEKMKDQIPSTDSTILSGQDIFNELCL